MNCKATCRETKPSSSQQRSVRTPLQECEEEPAVRSGKESLHWRYSVVRYKPSRKAPPEQVPAIKPVPRLCDPGRPVSSAPPASRARQIEVDTADAAQNTARQS